MELPLIKGKAAYDLTILQQLVGAADAHTVRNPADGKDYALAYEYADPSDGVGAVAQEVSSARTLAQYQTADADALGLSAGLRAMLDNLRDPTPYN